MYAKVGGAAFIREVRASWGETQSLLMRLYFGFNGLDLSAERAVAFADPCGDGKAINNDQVWLAVIVVTCGK